MEVVRPWTCPKISVVVPIYNIEQYVGRCIESLFRQTYPHIEIILVDDGSTDGSPAICDQYQQRTDNILVIHQENQGLSAARNAGAKAASGEYITFLDGDDYVHEQFLSTLFELLSRGCAQIAVCGMAVVRGAGRRTPKPLRREGAVYTGREALSVMLYQKQFDISACGKLYRREDVLGCPFPVGRVYEDILPVARLVCHAERVVWTPAKLYCYYQRAGSIIHTQSVAPRIDELDMTDEMYAFVVQNCPAAEPAALCKKFSNYSQVLAAAMRSKNTAQGREIRERTLKFMRECAPRVMRDPQARCKNRLAAAALRMVFPAGGGRAERSE